LSTIPNVGDSNAIFGWGKSRNGVVFELPEMSWWLGVKQAVDRSLDLALFMIHARSYAASQAAG